GSARIQPGADRRTPARLTSARPRDLAVRWSRSKEPPSTALSVFDTGAGRSVEVCLGVPACGEWRAGEGPHERQRSGRAFRAAPLGTELPTQAACLLGDPGCGRPRRAAGQEEPARGQLDEEDHDIVPTPGSGGEGTARRQPTAMTDGPLFTIGA